MMKNDPNNYLDVLVASTVSRVAFTGSVRIEFSNASTYLLRCESGIALESKSGKYSMRGTPWEETMVELDQLIGLKVVESRVADDGKLTIAFEDGSKLEALPDQQFESWQLSGPGRFLVVSLPGGETVEWKGEQRKTLNT